MEKQDKSQMPVPMQQLANICKSSMAIEIYQKKGNLLSGEVAENLTLEKAVKSGLHVESIKQKNRKELVMFLFALLKEFLSYVPHQLKENNMIQYAESMIADCPYWKPDDFVLCFLNGRTGKYGKLFGNFTYMNFSEWADKYEAERNTYFHEIGDKHKEPYDPVRSSVPASMKGLINDIVMPGKSLRK